MPLWLSTLSGREESAHTCAMDVDTQEHTGSLSDGLSGVIKVPQER